MGGRWLICKKCSENWRMQLKQWSTIRTEKKEPNALPYVTPAALTLLILNDITMLNGTEQA